MPLDLDGNGLTLSEIRRFLEGEERVSLTEEALEKAGKSRDLLEKVIEEAKEPVYGVTTGFGKLVNREIAPENRKKLQENLIRSHSAGIGEPLPREVVDTAILIRASSLSRGYSGIRPQTLKALVGLLNSGVTPFVPEKGSLGASGDLAPLAHVASVLTGSGKAFWQGETLTGKEALNRAGLEPVELVEKEGLALINGTPFMASMGALSAIEMEYTVKNADLAGAFTARVLNSNLDPFDRRIQKVRPYPTQMTVAENIRKLIGERPKSPEPTDVQDAYSIRCMPQVHGAVRLAGNHLKDIIEKELNSVTDNPLIFEDPPSVLSGGNFHGEPLALGADYAKTALTEMANISERRINRTLHPQLNGELPPFLSPNPGLNSGYMMAHYSAVSLVSENRNLSTPSSTDNTPVSGDQEDHVSMGMNSALNLRKVLDNLQRVLGVELLIACQAQEFRGEKLPDPLEACYKKVREKIPEIREDVEIRPLMNKGYQIVKENKCLDAVEERVKLT